MSRIVPLLASLIGCAVTAVAAAASPATVYCPALLDVADGELRGARLIRIEDGRIAAVEPATAATAAELRLPDGHTCLPGLTDLHVHLSFKFDENHFTERFTLNPGDTAFRMVGRAERTLQAGFTTVRDLGDTDDLSIALRDAIAAGVLSGPRIFTSSKSLATTGGHQDPTAGWRIDRQGNPGPAEGVINGVGAAREAVRQRYKRGADLIKINATGGVLSRGRDGANPQFTEDEIRAVVSTASDYGMAVAAHAHGAEGIKRAVRAGVRSIEHATLLDDEAIELMKQQGSWLIPTLSAGRTVAQRAEIPGYYPEVVRPKARRIGPLLERSFSRAFQAGVRIAFGSDSGVSEHGENAWEFVYMVAAGMPPLEALRSATLYAAEVLGRQQEMGQLAPGMLADIIAVDGQPLDDIAAMRRISLVIKDGRIYRQPQAGTPPADDRKLPDPAQPALQQEPTDPGAAAQPRP